jgi:hypothetical protein
MDQGHSSLTRWQLAGWLVASSGLLSLAWDGCRLRHGAALPWTAPGTSVLYVVTGLVTTQLPSRARPSVHWVSAALTGAWVLLLLAKVAHGAP